MYESRVIPKGIKTNYFTPTKIHIQYKTIKIYKKNNNNRGKEFRYVTYIQQLNYPY